MRSQTKLKYPISGVTERLDWIDNDRNKFKKENSVDNLLHYFYYSNLKDLFILSFFNDSNIEECKKICYELAKAKEAHFHYFGQSMKEGNCVNIEHYEDFTLAMFCDRLDLLQKFQYFEYNGMYWNKPITREEFMFKWGQMFSYSMQCIINQDFEKLNVCIEKAHLLTKKTDSYFKSKHYDLHIAVWEAIRDRNAEGLEIALLLLIKKTHRHFVSGHFWGDFISMPAIGYLKAAWYIGLEVEVKHKLIPMELMPIQPLVEYKNEFEYFLP